MTLDVGPLFTPLKVRGKELRNRIVMPPMVVLRGLTTEQGVGWYGRRARGGTALVIVEATPITHFSSELTAESLAPLVDAIHREEALAAIQLLPSVPNTPGRSLVADPAKGTRPNTTAFLRHSSATSPTELNRREIDNIVAGYKAAAQVCAEAGFDGVEPHGAHGYLLNKFFSPVQNERTDEYGGTLEGRMRLALRIVEIIRATCGTDMLILYRHTPVGPGYGIDESLVLAKALAEAGVDILDISPSSIDRPGDRAGPFKDIGVPVIAVGNLNVVERALEVLSEGRADLVAVGRGLIADPDWPLKVREGRFDELVKCARCNERCSGNLREGIPIECAEWGLKKNRHNPTIHRYRNSFNDRPCT